MKTVLTTVKGAVTGTDRRPGIASSNVITAHIVRSDKQRIKNSIKRYFDGRPPKEAA